MSQALRDLKSELYRRGIKLKKLSDAIGVTYDRTIRVLGGFALPDNKVLDRINAYIVDFDNKNKK